MADCPSCGATCSGAFFVLPGAPVVCNVLCDSAAQARAVPHGDIRLVVCPSCGLVFNEAFDPDAIKYSGEYENALHFSAVFREHESWLVRTLVEEMGVRDALVAEIGCGDGHFLGALCEAGDNRGVGFDPAFDEARHASSLHRRVRVTAEHFDASKLAGERLGAVCCRHVLEHIPVPRPFVQGLREQLESPETVVCFEVPSAMQVLRSRGFWDVLYEHCTYYAPVSMRRLFGSVGFPVTRCEHRYGEQFLCLFANPGDAERGSAGDEAEVAEVTELAGAFGRAFEVARDAWRERLLAMEGPVVVWGAGTKGVMFLAAMGEAAERVDRVVDLNPRKHRKLTVGTARPIVGPEDLRSLRPKAILVMNPAYRDEIAEQARALGLEAEVLVVQG